MRSDVSLVLRAAAQRIECNGWRQGAGGGFSGGPQCIMRALADECACEVEFESAKSALLRRVRPPGGLMSSWNDAPDRTVDEVLAALRGAADDVEAGR